MRSTILLPLAVFALATPAGMALAQGESGTAGRPITVQMTGAAERPGPGDPDGSGTAVFRLNAGQGRVCFDLTVEDIILPTIGAHIHRADVNSAGPIEIALEAPDDDGASSGCVEDVDRQLIRDILTNPSAFYVNVHTTDFPGGAVRAQLGRRP